MRFTTTLNFITGERSPYCSDLDIVLNVFAQQISIDMPHQDKNFYIYIRKQWVIHTVLNTCLQCVFFFWNNARGPLPLL